MSALPWWATGGLVVCVLAARAGWNVQNGLWNVAPAAAVVQTEVLPVVPAAPSEPARERALREVSRRVEGEPVLTEVLDGPDGTLLVRAWVEGAPTSARALVVDEEGTTYGERGDRDLAELARKKAWRQRTPAPEELARVALFALRDGAWQTYTATVENEGADFAVVLSGKQATAKVTFPATGDAEWIQRGRR